MNHLWLLNILLEVSLAHNSTATGQSKGTAHDSSETRKVEPLVNDSYTAWWGGARLASRRQKQKDHEF